MKKNKKYWLGLFFCVLLLIISFCSNCQNPDSLREDSILTEMALKYVGRWKSTRYLNKGFREFWNDQTVQNMNSKSVVFKDTVYFIPPNKTANVNLKNKSVEILD